MAMSETGLATEIKNAMEALKKDVTITTGQNDDGSVKTETKSYIDSTPEALGKAIAKAVVNHIKNNATISGTMSGTIIATIPSPGAATLAFTGNVTIPATSIQ
jgi:hypothetical protein